MEECLIAAWLPVSCNLIRARVCMTGKFGLGLLPHIVERPALTDMPKVGTGESSERLLLCWISVDGFQSLSMDPGLPSMGESSAGLPCHCQMAGSTDIVHFFVFGAGCCASRAR